MVFSNAYMTTYNIINVYTVNICLALLLSGSSFISLCIYNNIIYAFIFHRETKIFFEPEIFRFLPIFSGLSYSPWFPDNILYPHTVSLCMSQIDYWVRQITGVERVGHIGTLDPQATGLLVIALGKCVRLVDIAHE